MVLKHCLLSFLFALSALASVAQENELVRGLYVGYDDFKANSPLGTDKFYLDTAPRKSNEWIGTESISVYLDETNRKVFNVWGFCDGHGQYIQMQKDFFKLEFARDTVSFYGYGRPEDEDLGPASNLAGTVGGASAASSARSDAKTRRVRYMLDPTSGAIINYPVPVKKAVPHTEKPQMKLVIYRGAKREMDSTITVRIEDQAAIAFAPSSYYQTELPLGRDSIKVCYGQAEDQCILIAPTASKVVYILASISDRGAVAKLEEVSTSQGEWDSEIARSLQLKREGK